MVVGKHGTDKAGLSFARVLFASWPSSRSDRVINNHHARHGQIAVLDDHKVDGQVT